MGDAEQMWITAVPALVSGEGDETDLVVLGIDLTSDDPGERCVDTILDRGHEGEEGVFYLLPFDMGIRYERHGDTLTVLVLTAPEVLDHMVTNYRKHLARAAAALPRTPDGAVLLARRQLTTPFDPTTDEVDQTVVLLAQAGPATEERLFTAFDEGEATLAVLGPYGEEAEDDS